MIGLRWDWFWGWMLQTKREIEGMADAPAAYGAKLRHLRGRVAMLLEEIDRRIGGEQ